MRLFIKKYDLEKIEFTKEILEIEEEFKGFLNSVKAMISNSTAYKIEKDNKIIAVFCYIEYIKSHYYGFIIPTIHTKKYGLFFAREIKKIITNLIKTKKPVRIGTESLDNSYLNRWHKWLGFEIEGIKKNFIGNRTYNIWRFEKWV